MTRVREFSNWRSPIASAVAAAAETTAILGSVAATIAILSLAPTLSVRDWVLECDCNTSAFYCVQATDKITDMHTSNIRLQFCRLTAHTPNTEHKPRGTCAMCHIFTWSDSIRVHLNFMQKANVLYTTNAIQLTYLPTIGFLFFCTRTRAARVRSSNHYSEFEFHSHFFLYPSPTHSLTLCAYEQRSATGLLCEAVIKIDNNWLRMKRRTERFVFALHFKIRLENENEKTNQTCHVDWDNKGTTHHTSYG